MRAVLSRTTSQSKQTLGTLEVFDADGKKVFACKTLELPWLENKRQKSCIPVGVYNITPRTSPKYGSHYLVNDVPQRDTILIHYGNFNTDILGCILVGAAHADINGDGFPDVTASKGTLAKLLKTAPDGFTLTIHEV